MKSYALVLGLFAMALALSTGCSRPPRDAANKADQGERYPLTGEIIRVEADRSVLVVRHDEIKGYMPAMTMEFLVSPGDIAAAKPGQRIRAELIPSDDGDFRLEKIWPADKAVVDTVAEGARRLREDTHNRGRQPYREVGEKLPEFALLDQDGRVVQSTRFSGKQIMLNFIFTRCPVATMCPAATNKMVATQKLAREAGVPNIHFVSITLEPEYDTPGVLNQYAKAYGADTENFSFLTGPETAIKDLLAQFGVLTEMKGDLLTHTLTTLLIDESGKIIQRVDGTRWEPADFVARMKK
jgi:protein SCO1